MLKKMVVLMILAAVAILPVAADPIVMTGDVYTGFIYDFTTTPVTVGYYGYTNLYAKATVSPWISATYWLYYYMGNLAQNEILTTSITGTSNVIVPAQLWLTNPTVWAYATLDLTKPLAIDPKMFDLTLTAGNYGSWDNAYSNVTAGGYEDVSVAGAGGYDWFVAGLAQVSNDYYLKAAVAPRTNGDYILGAYATPNLGFGTVRAEVFFNGPHRTDIWNGVFIIDGRLEVPMGADAVWVGAGFNYDLNPTLNANTTQQFKWAGTAKYLMGTFLNVAASVWGNNLDILDGASYTLYLTPIYAINKDVTLDLCASGRFSFESNAVRTAANKTLVQGIDTAVRLNIGTADVYLGYVYTTIGGGAIWGANIVNPLGGSTNAASANGGLYMRYYQPF